MSEQNEAKKVVRFKNDVRIVGKLSSADLQTKTNDKGNTYVYGKVAIATDLEHCYSVKVFINEKKFDGSENKSYVNALDLLTVKEPTSMKNLMEKNATMTREQAFENAPAVYAFGAFEDWETEQKELRNGIRAIRVGLSKPDKEFRPEATFEVDAYIEKKTPIQNADMEEEGVKILGVIPTGSEDKPSAVRVDLIARSTEGPDAQNVVDYINDNFNVKDTVRFTGDIVNLMKRETVASAKSFGRASQDQVTTTFIDERILRGGNAEPYEEDSDLYLTDKEVKKRLTNRQVAIDEQKAAAKKSADNKAAVADKQWGFGMDSKASKTVDGADDEDLAW